MSDDSTNLEQQSDESTASYAQSTPPKKRSIVERILVWGVILGLGAVALLEWRAQDGYDKSLVALQNAWERGNLTHSKAETLIVGSPAFDPPAKDGNSPHEFQSFTWSGIFPAWRSYTIKLEIEPGVVSDEWKVFEIHTEVANAEVARVAAVSEAKEDPTQTVDPDAEGGDGEGSGGGRRQRRSFEDIDTNKDQKISKDEVTSERAWDFYTQNDSNSDGVLDKKEFDEMRQRFAQGRRGQGQGRGGQGRGGQGRDGQGQGRGGSDGARQRPEPEQDDEQDQKKDEPASKKAEDESKKADETKSQD